MKGELTLKQAIDYTYKERWSQTETGDRSVVQAERLSNMLGENITLSELSGRRGMIAIQEVRDKLLEVVGETTVDRHLTALKTVLIQMVSDLEPEGFVVPKIRLFNKKKRKERIMSKPEELEFFKLIASYHFEYGELFTIMLDTGLRLGEALKIKWVVHICLDSKTIRLRAEDTKNGKPRTIPMTERVHTIFSRSWREDTVRAFPFTARTCQRVFEQIRILMGLREDKEFTPHMLRHTLTTRLLTGGARKWKVQAILGHSNAKMTSWYHHYCDDDLKDAMMVLE